MSRLQYATDELTGTKHFVEVDESEDAIHWTSEQDVSGLVAWNRAQYNEHNGERWRELNKVASLPAIFVVKLMADGTLYDSKRLRRFLNDHGFRDLRTRPGHL